MNITGTNATSANGQCTNRPILRLVAHRLEIGVKAAIGLNVRVTDIVTMLGRFATKRTLLGHNIPPI